MEEKRQSEERSPGSMPPESMPPGSMPPESMPPGSMPSSTDKYLDLKLKEAEEKSSKEKSIDQMKGEREVDNFQYKEDYTSDFTAPPPSSKMSTPLESYGYNDPYRSPSYSPLYSPEVDSLPNESPPSSLRFSSTGGEGVTEQRSSPEGSVSGGAFGAEDLLDFLPGSEPAPVATQGDSLTVQKSEPTTVPTPVPTTEQKAEQTTSSESQSEPGTGPDDNKKDNPSTAEEPSNAPGRPTLGGGGQGGGAPEKEEGKTEKVEPENPDDDKKSGDEIKLVEQPAINVDNLDYLLDNSEMLSNVVDIISIIYSKKPNKDIEKLLLYVIDLEQDKYKEFINYFRKNNTFMNKLDSDNELFKKLYDKNIMEDLDKLSEKEEIKAGKGLEEDQDEEDEEEYQNNYSLNKCKQAEDELHQLIKKGGPFIHKQALNLEYCRKNRKKLTKKK